MIAQSSIYYIVAEAFCAFMLLLLLLADHVVGSHTRTGRWFRQSIVGAIIYFFFDTCWAIIKGNVFEDRQQMVALINTILGIVLNHITYLTFIFITMYEGNPISSNKKKRGCCMIPAILVSMFEFALYFVKPSFIADPNGELTNFFNILFLSMPILYCFGAIYLSFSGAFKKRNRNTREAFFVLGLYPLMMLVAGSIEVVLVSVPLFCYTMTAGMIFIYITFTSSVITKDAVTGLDVRSVLHHYVDRLYRSGKVEKYMLFMLDMNGLKSMNDIYGHQEGDHALRTIGAALESVMRENGYVGRIARYGGDEFIAIVEMDKAEEAEDLITQVRSAIERFAEQNELRSVPAVAAGYVKLQKGRRNFRKLLHQADERMYINKRAQEAENRGMDLFRDTVTGLPNANYYNNAADETLKSLLRAGRKPAVLFFDVLGMHMFNDRFGYEEGNELLKLCGDTISDQFPGDLVCRYTEDHFAVITTVRDAEQRAVKADQLVHTAARDQYVNLQAGICYMTDSSQSAVALVDRARKAKSYIRENHSIACQVYNGEVEHYYENRDYVLMHFDEAVEKGWIQPYYQPQVRSLTSRICGSEALARWVDPEQGVLSPAVFVPVLEKTHRIAKLDLCIIEQVCRKLHEFAEESIKIQPVSVNLSRVDFQSCDIFSEVERLRDQYHVSPSYLKIEITESSLAQDAETLKEAIRKFREAGYEVWMDDFGSDFASLRNLQDYSFDLLKIDMGFLRSFDTNPRTKTMLQSIIDMAKRLKIHTLCEGVETQEMYVFLRNAGCERIQGYLISKPVPMDEMIALVKSGKYGYEPETENKYYDRAGLIDFLSNPTAELGGVATDKLSVTILEREADGSIRSLFANDRWMQVMGKFYAGMEHFITCINQEGDPARIFYMEIMDASGKTEDTVTKLSLVGDKHLHIRMKRISWDDEREMFATSGYFMEDDMKNSGH